MTAEEMRYRSNLFLSLAVVLLAVANAIHVVEVNRLKNRLAEIEARTPAENVRP